MIFSGFLESLFALHPETVWAQMEPYLNCLVQEKEEKRSGGIKGPKRKGIGLWRNRKG